MLILEGWKKYLLEQEDGLVVLHASSITRPADGALPPI
jgi:hypothetical protein